MRSFVRRELDQYGLARVNMFWLLATALVLDDLDGRDSREGFACVLEGDADSLEKRFPGQSTQAPTPGRPGPGPYACGDAEGVGRAVSARVAKMSSMSRIPWGVMPIVC